MARTPRHRRFGPHRRRGAIHQSAPHLGFRHPHLRLAANVIAWRRPARLLGFAGGRSARVGERDWHQGPCGRCDDRDADPRRRLTLISSPPPEHSTACCCGTITSCRNGPITKCASRAGTVSAIPIHCRNTAWQGSRPCGGGTRRRLQRQVAVSDFRLDLTGGSALGSHPRRLKIRRANASELLGILDSPEG